MKALWTWLCSLPGMIAAQVRETFWALLGLNGDQQRALMTWGMLGAIAVLSAGAWWVVDLLHGFYPKDGQGEVAMAVVTHIADMGKLVIILMGLMAGGMVLIARGGEMTVKGPGGIEISARGTAATRELAKSADVTSAMPPPTEGEGKP